MVTFWLFAEKSYSDVKQDCLHVFSRRILQIFLFVSVSRGWYVFPKSKSIRVTNAAFSSSLPKPVLLPSFWTWYLITGNSLKLWQFARGSHKHWHVKFKDFSKSQGFFFHFQGYRVTWLFQNSHYIIVQYISTSLWKHT